MSRVDVRWIKRGGGLERQLRETLPQAPRKDEIERAARDTNALGPQPLAVEYGERDATRTPDVVRSASYGGDLLALLVHERRPPTVVEFGTAFGVSGMYICAALDAEQHGHLYTFELNDGWAAIAQRNLERISSRFTLTRGTFEDHVDTVVSDPIDFAFVDGIHTYDFVMRQFEILKPRLSPGALIAFDDIDFKRPGARMREAWLEIAASPDVVAAAEVERRLGLAELA